MIKLRISTDNPKKSMVELLSVFHGLTKKETEILFYSIENDGPDNLFNGRSAIADVFDLSKSTLRVHIKNLVKKKAVEKSGNTYIVGALYRNCMDLTQIAVEFV